ncbi:hypothetical protein DPMN_079865 [Dreissena polymorpha]|uniref:Protein sleepless n=2 Tax=Dreissena polymorpha TaxID=45954 RepID=A0A9D3YPS7_DREPO|nr:hypothetical protein DPMN_079865 [Dreissena polymorpha]
MVFFICVLQLGQALQCYECMNLKDKACGTSYTASDKYNVTCEPEATACRKLEYRDSLQGITTDGVVVTRSCWTSPGKEGYAPEKCEKMFSSHVCYCTTDGCNGGQLVQPHRVLVSVALLSLLQFVFRLTNVSVGGK